MRAKICTRKSDRKYRVKNKEEKKINVRETRSVKIRQREHNAGRLDRFSGNYIRM